MAIFPGEPGLAGSPCLSLSNPPYILFNTVLWYYPTHHVLLRQEKEEKGQQ